MYTTSLLSRLLKGQTYLHHGFAKRLFQSLPGTIETKARYRCSPTSGLVASDYNSVGNFLTRHCHSKTLSMGNSDVITCKGAVCRGVGQPIRLEEIKVEPPKAHEVRVKMLKASLCHTDILFANGVPFPIYPRALGHEGVGLVESIGEGVTELKKGDLVIPTFLGECQECENCMSGKTNVCPTYPLTTDGLMPDGTSRMTVGGKTLYHLFTCSTWAEYTVMNVNYLAKVDPRIPLAHASIMSCGFTTGYGACLKEANVEEGSTVAVFGLGAVGLGAIEGARMQGASRIIGVDVKSWKMEKGKVFGMTDFINPKRYEKSVPEIIKEMTGGQGVDCCIECTGLLVNEALDATKVGKGKTVLIGAGKTPRFEASYFTLLMGRDLKGSVFGGMKTKTDLPILLDKCMNKEIKLDELITHEISLDEIHKASDLLKQPDCIKVLIKI